MNNVRHVSGNIEIKSKQKTKCSFLKLAKFWDDFRRIFAFNIKRRWLNTGNVSRRFPFTLVEKQPAKTAAVSPPSSPLRAVSPGGKTKPGARRNKLFSKANGKALRGVGNGWIRTKKKRKERKCERKTKTKTKRTSEWRSRCPSILYRSSPCSYITQNAIVFCDMYLQYAVSQCAA